MSFYYDESKAEQARKFIQNLKHTKGVWAGQRFDLMDWQRDDIVNPTFGMVREDGYRKFKTVYCEIPKKNGKSELAAGIALKLLFADGEYGAEVYSAAADKLQASIVFNVAAQMVRMSPELSKRCKIIDSQKRIVVPKTANFYCALSSDVKQKHGFNAHGVIFDELHAQPNRDLWDVLTVGSGAARKQQLIFTITTAGYDRNSICWEIHDYAEKVLSGVIDDPYFLPVLYGVPMDANWEDENEWLKANPALGHILTLDDMRQEYRQAKERAAAQNSFRRLRLNQWTQSVTRFIDISVWDECGGGINVDRLRGRHCYAGLDLASTTDIAALVLVFPPDNGEGEFEVLCYFWIPEDTMIEKIKKDRVPYDVWVREGLVEATEGNLIDYDYIIHTIDKLAQMFTIKELAFDRWGSAYIVTKLQERGMNVIDFGQGYASMSPATKDLEAKVLAKQIKHGMNPVLRWMCDNLVVRMDPAGNIKPDKEKSTQKIDGMVALIMALDRAVRNTETASVYESRGIVFL